MYGIDNASADVFQHYGAVDPDQVAAATAVDAIAATEIGNGCRCLSDPAINIGGPCVVLAVGPATGIAGNEAVGADP